jgi:hypothetical protein
MGKGRKRNQRAEAEKRKEQGGKKIMQRMGNSALSPLLQIQLERVKQFSSTQSTRNSLFHLKPTVSILNQRETFLHQHLRSGNEASR